LQSVALTTRPRQLVARLVIPIYIFFSGGKSTFMRSVALCIYLTQIGSFVPCSTANVSPVDNILLRMGARDFQYNGISTFMNEMLDVSKIIRIATPRSLVLIDEIGRGTSTFDGFGLAWSISNYIATELKACTLFATHFHEVTLLANDLSNVKNLYCDAAFENDQLTLLYKICEGECKNSFGIEVAKMAGFPRAIINHAGVVLQSLESS
jgi:DNA mismatch repair protein MSH2